MQRVCILCFIFCTLLTQYNTGYNLAGNHSAMAPWLTRLIRKWAIPPTQFFFFPSSSALFRPPYRDRNHRVGGIANALSWALGGNSRSLGAPLCPLRFPCHIARSLPEHHHSGPVLPSTIPGPYRQSAPLRVGSPIDKVA